MKIKSAAQPRIKLTRPRLWVGGAIFGQILQSKIELHSANRQAADADVELIWKLKSYLRAGSKLLPPTDCFCSTKFSSCAEHAPIAILGQDSIAMITIDLGNIALYDGKQTGAKL